VGPERGGVETRFFFDRNLGKKVPEALAAEGWAVERHDDHFDHKTPDKTLFREVSARRWVFVTQDKRIRFRGPERQALLDHGLRTFSVASTANLSAGETIDVLMRAQQAILETVKEREGPFVVGIHKDGSLYELTVRRA
jgi:hypothetical protein